MATEDEVMENDEEVAENGKKEKKPSKGNKTTLIIILMGFLVMTVTPLTTWLLVRSTAAASSPENPAETAEEKEDPEKKAAEILFAIDPLVVNIAETRMTRILRLEVHLVLSEQRLQPVLEEMMPIVKDRIMEIAGRRTLAELEDGNSRIALKRDIVLALNDLVRNRMAGSIEDVAFSEFLIQ